MDDTHGNCIYCGIAVELQQGQGDHVVPAALGRFKGEFIFRRICKDCNSLLGGCEEQLFRCAPEAYIRRLVQPNLKRSKRGTGWVGANGMPPPKFTLDHGSHRELVRCPADDPRTFECVDQLVVLDKDKGEHHILLYPQMTIKQLRAKINSMGLKLDSQSYLHCDEVVWSKYVALLKELYPGSTIDEGEVREIGMHRHKSTTVFTFHADYWRAIAKIGFQYYLLNTRRGLLGDEPEFAGIRRYIIEGGDHTEFFDQTGTKFVMPFGAVHEGSAILPGIWTHILASDESNQEAISMVSLFMGPENLAKTYHIKLGGLRSTLVLPRAQFAHVYLYNAEPDDDTYAGEVAAIGLTEITQ